MSSSTRIVAILALGCVVSVIAPDKFTHAAGMVVGHQSVCRPALFVEYIDVGKPKLVGGPPQSQSKCRDQDSCKGSNGSVVFASGDATTSRMQFQTNDKFDEQGIFLVKGAIGLVFLALVYAFFKRL